MFSIKTWASSLIVSLAKRIRQIYSDVMAVDTGWKVRFLMLFSVFFLITVLVLGLEYSRLPKHAILQASIMAQVQSPIARCDSVTCEFAALREQESIFRQHPLHGQTFLYNFDAAMKVNEPLYVPATIDEFAAANGLDASAMQKMRRFVQNRDDLPWDAIKVVFPKARVYIRETAAKDSTYRVHGQLQWPRAGPDRQPKVSRSNEKDVRPPGSPLTSFQNSPDAKIVVVNTPVDSDSAKAFDEIKTWLDSH